ncbi:cellulose binding domain-containing protein [Allorhizocola rhizosphaerae]|uniref:cellulose binding domain-containing protein n=1 Tax=Allorhizocola rhizosphaerae TaxID=1872709 RepID=UPI0013C349A8|nr:cellulose binding domain-containing protein [Allorhizocola rhizosphaerae]
MAIAAGAGLATFTGAVVLGVGAQGGTTPQVSEQLRAGPGSSTYQISADGGRTWSRQLPRPEKLHLRRGSFDPLTAPAARQRQQRGNVYIVQFAHAPLDSQREQLRALGARLGAYLPDAAYVVRMPAAVRDKVAALPYIRWVGPYEPQDKFDPAQRPGEGSFRYQIWLVEPDRHDQKAVKDRIEGLGGVVHLASVNNALIEATLDAAQFAAVAALDEVLSLDRWSAPQADMDIAREASGANLIETARGYRGQGVRAEVMDGGLLTTHQEFQARPPLLHTANNTDTGHGTATYGQIFSSGVQSAYRGLLPEAQGIFASYYAYTDRYAHTAELVNPSGPYRAVFQSNSWGSGLTTAYNNFSAEMDEIVFDHDILICQSQSNWGTQDSRPEAWAKNVVAVGGYYHQNTLNRGDDAWSGGASIGPAADGRIKPDLSNYYDSVNTTTDFSNTAYRSDFGGTSAATPITCGSFGLLYQMWADGVFSGGPGLGRDVFDSRPHAATAKALMLNQAQQHPFTGTTHDLTRVHQGWGSASVGNLYNQAAANGWQLPILVNETDLLTVGATKTYTLTTDGTQPLKATLVWTDPAGSSSASKAQVNDLTLKVTAPNGTTAYWGNNGLNAGNWSVPGGSPNTVDTVENVFIQNPAAGTWTIQVSADLLGADGHVETAATDADYALVVTGSVDGVTSPSPSPSATSSPSPQPGKACQASYTIVNQWSGGFQAEVKVTNTGTAGTAGWRLNWTFGAGQTISYGWSGIHSQTGPDVTVVNESWNATINPGNHTNYGFNGTWNNQNNPVPVVTCTAL